jgi:hypothetical protein
MIFSTQLSYAALLIEPYLGYKVITDGEEGTKEYDTKGIALGGRIGYQQLGLMGGIDFNTSSFDLKTTTTTATTENDASSSDFGIFVGYNAPILVRVWISYYLSSSLDFKNSTESEYKGNGYALGVGYTGFPFISLNFEYKQKSYDELETSTATSNLNPEADFNEILLSVSLPLSF